MAECFEERRDSRQLRGDGRQQTEFICRPAVASDQPPSELQVMRLQLHPDDDDDDDDDAGDKDDDDDDDGDGDKDDGPMRHIHIEID